jgi:hypothetical protein
MNILRELLSARYLKVCSIYFSKAHHEAIASTGHSLAPDCQTHMDPIRTTLRTGTSAPQSAALHRNTNSSTSLARACHAFTGGRFTGHPSKVVSETYRSVAMRAICAIFVCSMLTACSAVEFSEETIQGEENPDLGVAESEVFQCGLSCGAGSHPVAYSCNLGCGPCPPNNQSDCRPNTGSSFFMCGFRCPSPYRTISSSFTSVCIVSGLGDNQVLCRL